MILEFGNKVLIVHRRLFETDHPRFFVGVVEAYEEGIAKVTGFSWVKDTFAGKLVEKQQERCKIFAIASGTLMVYLLPSGTDIAKLTFEQDKNGSLWLTDHVHLKMDLSEREHGAHRK